jgi:hypothetical protein
MNGLNVPRCISLRTWSKILRLNPFVMEGVSSFFERKQLVHTQV